MSYLGVRWCQCIADRINGCQHETTIHCHLPRLQWLPSLVTTVDCTNRSGSARRTALELAMEEASVNLWGFDSKLSGHWSKLCLLVFLKWFGFIWFHGSGFWRSSHIS